MPRQQQQSVDVVVSDLFPAVYSIQFKEKEGYRVGPDHVSLKIKQSFQVHSISLSITKFCAMAIKTQFMTGVPICKKEN